MLDYTNVIRLKNSYKNVLVDYEKQRLAHTYLLENKDMDLCFCFAKFLSCLIIKGKNPDDVFMGKLEKNIHPDIKIFGLEKKIMADDASNIVSDVYVMPFEEDRKVYILLYADSMTNESQNKLLKTLEEPPESAYFVLCAKNEKTLLQTILSRSKKIELEDPTSDEIKDMLVSSNIENVTAQIASVICGGDASKAFTMSGNVSFIKLYNNVFEMFGEMNSSKDVLKFVSKFTLKEFDVLEFLSIVETIARDLVYTIAKTDKLIQNKHRIADLQIISKSFTVEALTKILKECFDFREALYYNVSITPALDEFLLKFVEVKVKCKK